MGDVVFSPVTGLNFVSGGLLWDREKAAQKESEDENKKKALLDFQASLLLVLPGMCTHAMRFVANHICDWERRAQALQEDRKTLEEWEKSQELPAIAAMKALRFARIDPKLVASTLEDIATKVFDLVNSMLTLRWVCWAECKDIPPLGCNPQHSMKLHCDKVKPVGAGIIFTSV